MVAGRRAFGRVFRTVGETSVLWVRLSMGCSCLAIWVRLFAIRGKHSFRTMGNTSCTMGKAFYSMGKTVFTSLLNMIQSNMQSKIVLVEGRQGLLELCRLVGGRGAFERTFCTIGETSVLWGRLSLLWGVLASLYGRRLTALWAKHALCTIEQTCCTMYGEAFSSMGKTFVTSPLTGSRKKQPVHK